MFENLKYAVYLFAESLRNGKLLNSFRQQVFIKRQLIPAFLELTTLDDTQDPLINLGYLLFELTLDDIQKGKWDFLVAARRLRALRNLKRGLRGFILVKESTIVGDIWCVAPRNMVTSVTHPDLIMLGITCNMHEMYSTDMFIVPHYRGKKLSIPFHRAFELRLKQEGWKRDYVGYYADNLPAVNMHRALNFIELPRRRVTRFFSFIKSEQDA